MDTTEAVLQRKSEGCLVNPVHARDNNEGPGKTLNLAMGFCAVNCPKRVLPASPFLRLDDHVIRSICCALCRVPGRNGPEEKHFNCLRVG
jgi:hypothetical protein